MTDKSKMDLAVAANLALRDNRIMLAQEVTEFLGLHVNSLASAVAASGNKAMGAAFEKILHRATRTVSAEEVALSAMRAAMEEDGPMVVAKVINASDAVN